MRRETGLRGVLDFWLFIHSLCIIGRQLPGSVKNRQGTVLIAMHMHFGFDVMSSVPVIGNLQRKVFETHAIVFADGAFELLAQDVGQTSAQERHECRTVFQRPVARIQR